MKKIAMVMGLFFCFGFIGCQSLSGVAGLPTPAESNQITDDAVLGMIAQSVDVDKIRIEITDSLYSLPNKSEIVDALLVAKNELGITNGSDNIGTKSGPHPVFRAPSQVVTQMDEQGLCLGGIDKIIKSIDKYQVEKASGPFPWPVGVASDFSGLRCLIFVATKDDGVLFFDPNKLYEDSDTGNVDQIIF